MTMYAYYRRQLRAMGPSPAGMMPYFCGDGGDTDWTAQRVHYKGERWLERTKHGYMPAEAVEEMRELRAVFDRGGWWTVLAWVAACPRPKRVVNIRGCAHASLFAMNCPRCMWGDR